MCYSLGYLNFRNNEVVAKTVEEKRGRCLSLVVLSKFVSETFTWKSVFLSNSHVFKIYAELKTRLSWRFCILYFQFNYENLIRQTDNNRIVLCDKSSISKVTKGHPTFAVANFSLVVSQLASWLLTRLQSLSSLSMCSIVREVDYIGSNHTALSCTRIIFLCFCTISLYYFCPYFSIAF